MDNFWIDIVCSNVEWCDKIKTYTTSVWQKYKFWAFSCPTSTVYGSAIYGQQICSLLCQLRKFRAGESIVLRRSPESPKTNPAEEETLPKQNPVALVAWRIEQRSWHYHYQCLCVSNRNKFEQVWTSLTFKCWTECSTQHGHQFLSSLKERDHLESLWTLNFQ